MHRQKYLNKTNFTGLQKWLNLLINISVRTNVHLISLLKLISSSSSSSFRLSFNTWPKYRNSETKLNAHCTATASENKIRNVVCYISRRTSGLSLNIMQTDITTTKHYKGAL